MEFGFLILTVAIVLSNAATLPPAPSETFQHSVVLDENGNYTLYWKFDDKTITFEVHVQTTGWVGLGISPSGGMTGSDVVIGWVAADGKAYLKDRHATGNKMPIVDPHQDWFLLSGREEAGFTVLKFYRALDTKDCAYDRVITQDTLRLIWSFRHQDPSGHDDIMYHGTTNRGVKSVNLLQLSPIRESPDLANAVSMTLRHPDIVVSNASRTAYYCRTFRAPNVTQRHHIVKYSPLVPKANVGVIHHIIVYGCYLPNPDQFAGLSSLCFDGSMPFYLLMCRYPFAVWGAGGQDFYFPDDVGLSIGGPGDPNIFILETHYDNPDLKAGIVDNSGITFWYTPDLRRYDAAVFIFGNDGSPQLAIPPQTSQFTVSGICHSNCTSQMLPAGGVNVFASVLHAHIMGRTIRVRHFRGDKEIGDFGIDNQYDFDYQQSRSFNPHRVIRPGDTVITQCTFDSTSRQKVAFGGIETTDEMCLGWLLYYPKVDLNFCSSQVDGRGQLTALNHPLVDSLPHDGDASISDFQNALRNTTWTPSLIAALQKAQTHSRLGYTCASIEPEKSIELPDAPFPANLKFTADPEPDCFPLPSAAVGGHAAARVAFWTSLLLSMTVVAR